MTTKFCPVCDSENIEIKKDFRRLVVPLAEPVLQEISVCHCNDCMSDILLDSESKKNVQNRILERAKESVPELLKKVNENGYSDSRLERALGLAPHTINRWKQGSQVSAAAIALSRFMSILPELTLVAEAGFNEAFARSAILKKTIDKIKAVDSSVKSFYVNTGTCVAAGVMALNNSTDFEKSELTYHAQPVLVEV
ncbi:MAG: hypothetical protein MJZ28_13110 [Paludibacteraceae bacterium]|nr:hypothetical protein [Paludibacteraceae bacterium]